MVDIAVCMNNERTCGVACLQGCDNGNAAGIDESECGCLTCPLGADPEEAVEAFLACICPHHFSSKGRGCRLFSNKLANAVGYGVLKWSS